MRKLLFKIMILSVMIFCFSQEAFTGKLLAQSLAPSTPFLKINNYYVLFTTPKAPYIDKNNRFMVPLRSINDLLGDTRRMTRLPKRPSFSLGRIRLSLKWTQLRLLRIQTRP
ncbi:hypothetical protein ACIFOE_02655 [Paenibacillus sp. NRS-1783]|uniref:hypothetical protein n=1 Tax=Paenibacillus sp. NRS-1783 TaxID=3233907 RepID=UPI003D2AD1C0